MGILDDIKELVGNIFTQATTKYNQSAKWKEYRLGATKTHCKICYERNNKIYSYSAEPILPEHERCLCFLIWLRSIAIGAATNKGLQGVDCYLANYGTLPNFYITKEQAQALGWVAWTGNLDKVAPNRMIGGNVFNNRECKLPNAPGRVWYECDIDYNGGYRNNYRLIYSNDGLMFKTDDHYTRFIAVE